MATKRIKDLKKGDVIRTEFGADNNWVTVEIQKVVPMGETSCKMYCKYTTGNKVEMYCNATDVVELVEVKK